MGNVLLLDSLVVTLDADLVGALMAISGLCSQNGHDPEALQAGHLARKIAEKVGLRSTVPIQIKAVDILVPALESARSKGNDNLVRDIEMLIQLLKGGMKRQIMGAYLRTLEGNGGLREREDGALVGEVIIQPGK